MAVLAQHLYLGGDSACGLALQRAPCDASATAYPKLLTAEAAAMLVPDDCWITVSGISTRVLGVHAASRRVLPPQLAAITERQGRLIGDLNALLHAHRLLGSSAEGAPSCC